MDDTADAIWRALADPARREILDLLREKPRTTGQLASAFDGVTRFAVMKHLNVLRRVGLVSVDKQGREAWNHLNPVPLRRVYERWVGRFGDRWSASALRLKEAAERRAKEQAMSVDMQTDVRSAVVRTEIEIGAPVATVFDAFFEDARDWFFESEETKNDRPAVFERRVGGRLYMDLGNGDANLIAMVTMIKTNHKVRLRGDCTMPQAFVANMTVSFEETPGGCRVTVEHRMAGEFYDAMPAEFEEGWAEGLKNLKTWCEAK